MNIFWFRRDLRLDDNAGLFHALRDGNPVIPVFIFDTNILGDLADKSDRRVEFIHHNIEELHKKLITMGSSLVVKHANPLQAFKELTEEYSIEKVFTNHDYEPYAIQRDVEVEKILSSKNISFRHYKDQVIFERDEVLKDDRSPYTVFTPYSTRWKSILKDHHLQYYPTEKHFSNFFRTTPFKIPSLAELGFQKTDLVIPSSNVPEELMRNYSDTRNIPAIAGTSRMSVHLRFGTVSTRQLMKQARALSEKFFTELIWREFYSMILQHFPRVITESFKPEYDHIKWRNNEAEFEAWCEGKTGFPIVDAGMRELNATGFMHNRVRMITASFLTKDLLIDWRWGEAYFAKKLLDYELASNNGGWQWAASCGCDASPYFRIFNPTSQAKKFDPDFTYIRTWVPEFDSFDYPAPMVDHSAARGRALAAFKAGLGRETP